jgi:hypothetical protein
MNQRSRQAVEQCERIMAAFTRLQALMPEIERRTRFTAGGDGFSSSSFGMSGQVGAVSQPTERAALSRPLDDPIRRWSRDVIRLIDKADRTATELTNLLALLVDDHECRDCRRNDAPRLVAGRCDACRMRARRAELSQP